MKAESDFSPPARAPPAPSQLCVPAGCCRALHQAPPAPQVVHPLSRAVCLLLVSESNASQPLSLAPSRGLRSLLSPQPSRAAPGPRLGTKAQVCLHSPAACEQTPAAELRIPLPRVGKAAGGALSPLNIHTRLRALTAPAPAGTAPCSLAIPALRCHQHICNT